MEVLHEGAVSFEARKGEVHKGMEVFYNPVMKENRDITLSVLNTFEHEAKIALPLAGSGVRGLRILAESHVPVKGIWFNDHSEQAVAALKRNLEQYGYSQDRRLSVSAEDATTFLLQRQGFDYIDIDPFGSPLPYIESAVRRIARGGVIAATATDTAALCGSSPKAGARKYWARSLRCDMMHELGLRILIRRLQLAGTVFARALTPILAYAKDHYMRVFLRCRKGKQRCDELLALHGYITMCPHCLHRERSSKPPRQCPQCGGRCDYAGPLWCGGLAEEPHLFDTHEYPLIRQVVEESLLRIPFVYSLPVVAKKYGTGDILKKAHIMEQARKEGYHITPSHHGGEYIRTDAPVERIASWLRG